MDSPSRRLGGDVVALPVAVHAVGAKQTVREREIVRELRPVGEAGG